MRPVLRTIVRLFSLCGAVYLAGCFSTRTYPIATLPLPESFPVDIVGEVVLLRDARLQEDGSVVGWFENARGDSTTVRVPFQQEVREFDIGKTLLLTLGIGAVGAVVAFLVIISGIDS